MAKATSNTKGTSARPRPSAARSAGVTPVRERTDDEMRDEAQATADQAAAGDGEPEEMDAEEADENAFAVTPAEPAGISADAVARPIGRGLQVPSWAMGNPVTKWLAECVIELMKVTWPTPSEAWNLTLTVIVMSAVVAALLFAVDLGLQQALSWIVGLGG